LEKAGNDVEEIVAEVVEIDAISTQNAKSVEDIVSASEHLSEMTENLNKKLSYFKT